MSATLRSSPNTGALSLFAAIVALPACVVVEGAPDRADQSEITYTEFEPSPNLLFNGDTESGDLSGWTVTEAGGDGWAIKPTDLEGSEFGFYAARTSYGWCAREQLVDLVSAGFSPEYLDTAPQINVADWIRERFAADEFEVEAILLDENGWSIDDWYVSGTTPGEGVWTDDEYFGVSHSFTDYGPGVRYVLFRDGGQDTEYWGEHYGVEFDNSFVGISGQPL